MDLSCEIDGAKEVSNILKKATRPLARRCVTTRNGCPQEIAARTWKADFAVVQGVTQIASFIKRRLLESTKAAYRQTA